MGSPKWHRELKESEVEELLRKDRNEAQARRKSLDANRSTSYKTTIEAPEWRSVIEFG